MHQSQGHPLSQETNAFRRYYSPPLPLPAPPPAPPRLACVPLVLACVRNVPHWSSAPGSSLLSCSSHTPFGSRLLLSPQAVSVFLLLGEGLSWHPNLHSEATSLPQSLQCPPAFERPTRICRRTCLAFSGSAPHSRCGTPRGTSDFWVRSSIQSSTVPAYSGHSVNAGPK